MALNQSSPLQAQSVFFPKLWSAARKHPAHSGVALLLVVLLVASAVLQAARLEHLIVLMVAVLCGWLALGRTGEVPLVRGVALIALLAASAFVLWSILLRPRILLSGTVQDDKGQLVAAATVMLGNTGCLAWTDTAGRFVFESAACPAADSVSKPRVYIRSREASTNCAALPLEPRIDATIVLPASCLGPAKGDESDIVLDGSFTTSATKIDRVLLAGAGCPSDVDKYGYFAFRRDDCPSAGAIVEELKTGHRPLLTVGVGANL